MEHQNVTLRMPKELVDRIDKAVELERQRTGLRVDRSSLIRRALERDLAQLQLDLEGGTTTARVAV